MESKGREKGKREAPLHITPDDGTFTTYLITDIKATYSISSGEGFFLGLMTVSSSCLILTETMADEEGMMNIARATPRTRDSEAAGTRY